ncbi:hypothetical protein B9Z19DRAFT_52558 [Tuber borchii]|uniref:Uncharacterized protein n=1 Tax=Tuber borchii TaxID=42251 RepID=A0A2T6ZT50_TUBBO|nr:hypothetical protein B9Z19DRAFT_52558 [Tuber borchii]
MYDTGIGEHSHEAWACLTLDYIIWYGTGLECSGHGSIFCPLPNRAWWSFSTQPPPSWYSRSQYLGRFMPLGFLTNLVGSSPSDCSSYSTRILPYSSVVRNEGRRIAYTPNTDQVPLFRRTVLVLVLLKYSGSTVVRTGKLSIVVQFCTK